MDNKTKDVLADGCAGPLGCGGLLFSPPVGLFGAFIGTGTASAFGLTGDALLAFAALFGVGAIVAFWRAVIYWK